MKQFCENSFKNKKLSAELTASCQCVLWFSTPVSKVLRLPRRSEARSYEVLHLSRKIIFPKLKIWCSKMQHFSGNQRPDPNISDEHVSCTAPATENVSLQILFKCPTPATVFWNATKSSRFADFWLGTESLAPATQKRHLNIKKCSELRQFFLHFWLRNVPRATTACTFSTCQLPNVVRCWCALYMFTCNRASHHNGVHFSNTSISKSAPTLVCFVHFDLEMCFAPQRRAPFRHLNFQKRSEHDVFCTFWLANVLRATLACNFSSLIWPHGSTPTAYYSTLWSHKSLKKTVFRDFPTFSRTWIFFLLRLSLFWFFLLLCSSPLFSSLLFSSLLFSSLRFASLHFAWVRFASLLFSSLLFSSLRFSSLRFASLLSSCLLFSDSSHLSFSSVEIVGSLTSKLPSLKLLGV